MAVLLRGLWVVGRGSDNIVKSVYIFVLYLFNSTKNSIIIWKFC